MLNDAAACASRCFSGGRLPARAIGERPCLPRGAAQIPFTDSSSTFGKYYYLDFNVHGYAAPGVCDFYFNYVLAYYDSAAEQTRVENGLSLSRSELLGGAGSASTVPAVGQASN